MRNKSNILLCANLLCLDENGGSNLSGSDAPRTAKDTKRDILKSIKVSDRPVK